MASTASPTASTGFTASTARLTVPLLARPAARLASRARRIRSSAPTNLWELTILVAAVVLGLAILLDVVAILANFGRNLRSMSIPMDRQYDYKALLDKTLRDAAEVVDSYLRPPPEPFEATRLKQWRALLEITLDRVDNAYLSLWAVYDTDNQTVINYYEKLHNFQTEGLPILDRQLRHLADEISAYISVSNYDIEEAVMYMARVLTMDADEINMRWGARPPSGLVNHARRLIFGPPDVDPLTVRDRNLWDTLCICQAQLIELHKSLVETCNTVETVYNHITPPFISVSDFMYHEVQERRNIAEQDIKHVNQTYVNAMQAWNKRSSNRWRDSSNLFVHAFGRMLGGQTPPVGRGHVEQYEASKKTLRDLERIQGDLLLARAHIISLRTLAARSSYEMADLDMIAGRNHGNICESLEMDSFKESRWAPQELLTVLQQHVAAFVAGVRRWDADDFYNSVRLMQEMIENREVEESEGGSEFL